MDLTTGLVLLGVVVFVVLLVQAGLASRRARVRRASAERVQLAQEPAAAEATGSGERVEPGLGLTDAGPARGGAELRGPRRLPSVDGLIDAIVPLVLEQPVSAEAVLAHGPASRRAGTKPMAVEGLNTESGEWEPIIPGQRYSELQAAVQLVNRSGPLNQIEYSEFVQKTQTLADGLAASPEFPDMLEVVARARELDGLTAPLDAQLTVTLRPTHVAWSAGYIQQMAARHGFTPGVLPGRLVMPAAEEGAPPLLVLDFDPQAALAEDPQSAPLRECTLSLDVPQTPASAEAFPAWHHAAGALAADMDAQLVDDQGRAITLHAFAGIGRELQALYRRLEALELPAGSAAARRLFSG
jgi:hypothetical protein